MKTIATLLAAAMLLSACGGGTPATRSYGGAVVNFASGPISKACSTAGRKAANRYLCACIQGVADQSLSSSDQRLAATFYDDPHRAQEIRQSDRANHEVFWTRYKAYGARAERTCRGL